MAGITLTGRRTSYSYYDKQRQERVSYWNDWTPGIPPGGGGANLKGMYDKQNTNVCYRYNVDYTSVRALLQLAMKKALYAQLYYQDIQTATIGAYLYTSDPTGGDIAAVPSEYVGSATITSGQAYRSTVTFNVSCPNVTATTIYVLYSLRSNHVGNSDVYFDDGEENSVTATFKGFPTSMGITPGTVNTGSSITVTIGNAWTTETVQFYYGNTLLGNATISNGSGSVSIPKSWFTTAGVTTSQSMAVQARLVSTSLLYNFTVQAGSDMKPSVGTPAVSLVQDPAASDFPDTFIANISKAKIRATVSAGSNADIAAVAVGWSGGSAAMSVVSGAYEATVGPIAGDTVFTVTAVDARGMMQQASYSLTGVVPYTPPVITILSAGTYRCDSSGTEEDGGEYVRARAAAQIATSGLPGNAVRDFRIYIQEEPGKGDELYYNQQAEYWECGATAGRTSDYYETLVFELEDRIQTVTRSVRLPPATRNFTMKRSQGGTYIGIGVLPQHTSGESTVDIEEGGGYYEGGYLWGSITRLNSTATDGSQFSKNFKNVDTNLLHAPQNAEAFFLKDSDSGWSNSPVSGSFGGLRKVIWLDSTHYFVIILETAPTAGRIWISYNGGTWKSMTPA